MNKWGLLIRTLPWVAGVLALALIRDHVLAWPGLIEFTDVAPLLSAVALIVGLMLAGVLTDYKESEKIPAELASTLESLGDIVRAVAELNPDAAEAGRFDTRFQRLVTTVDDWFARRLPLDQCRAEVDSFRSVLTALHSAAGVNYTIRGLQELHQLRRLLARSEVISRTTFLPAGYALLDLLVGTTLVLLLVSHYKSAVAGYFLISLFSLIYLYLVRLIRDVDEPFAYAGQDRAAGSTEVDPFPIQEYRLRVERQRSGRGTARAAVLTEA